MHKKTQVQEVRSNIWKAVKHFKETLIAVYLFNLIKANATHTVLPSHIYLSIYLCSPAGGNKDQSIVWAKLAAIGNKSSEKIKIVNQMRLLQHLFKQLFQWL